MTFVLRCPGPQLVYNSTIHALTSTSTINFVHRKALTLWRPESRWAIRIGCLMQSRHDRQKVDNSSVWIKKSVLFCTKYNKLKIYKFHLKYEEKQRRQWCICGLSDFSSLYVWKIIVTSHTVLPTKNNEMNINRTRIYTLKFI